MGKLSISMNVEDLKRLIRDKFQAQLGMDIEQHEISIMVKSKQNYKSEWEEAEFKAEVEKVY